MAGQAKAQRRFGYLADRGKYQKSNIKPGEIAEAASHGARKQSADSAFPIGRVRRETQRKISFQLFKTKKWIRKKEIT
jgi:hypothetical protein